MTDEAMSPLRRRMIEDMTIRKFAPKTQHDYVQRVKNFAAFLGRSPDTASFEDVRRYQLHLAASGVGVPTINQTVSTLRFFFRGTLRRHEIVAHTHVIHEPRKLAGIRNPSQERTSTNQRPPPNPSKMTRSQRRDRTSYVRLSSKIPSKDRRTSRL
ncbi:phage integrase N-terminal SAM-like domain-containing protein [Bradyrhizobium diazoefficiens]|uniref:phage integrase N-terminal SAM-like domain-containing protein n=1 Tax=Bradyrhizobium diazoefficiens TaxID=1355477 RepID=UPI001FEEB142|nr:phage integrase N-terminal SAM-like domain-containing protein [Bradyrhizobium diazoefficiens]